MGKCNAVGLAEVWFQSTNFSITNQVPDHRQVAACGEGASIGGDCQGLKIPVLDRKRTAFLKRSRVPQDHFSVPAARNHAVSVGRKQGGHDLVVVVG